MIGAQWRWYSNRPNRQDGSQSGAITNASARIGVRIPVAYLLLDLQASAMLSDQDVWRAAIALVDRYGADACAEASKRATDMVIIGNFGERTEWMRILAAVLELQEKESPGPVH